MSEKQLSCPLCGHRFNPQEHGSCEACVLQKDCIMVCCPACGYSTVDADRSKAVKWVSSLLKKDAHREKA